MNERLLSHKTNGGYSAQLRHKKCHVRNGKADQGISAMIPSKKEKAKKRRKKTRNKHARTAMPRILHSQLLHLANFPSLPIFSIPFRHQTLQFVSVFLQHPPHLALPGAPESGWLSSNRFLQSFNELLNPRLSRSPFFAGGWVSKSNVLLSR